MAKIKDLFPASALDSEKWTSATTGSGALTIGSPSDGVYPSGVDDVGDGVLVSSTDRVLLPSNLHADFQIEYNNIVADPSEDLLHFLGWRSTWGGGSYTFGVELHLVMRPGDSALFMKRVTDSGVTRIEAIVEDPNAGANGKLRVVRKGFDTLLYRWEPETAPPDAPGDDVGWKLLDTVTLSQRPPGYIVFGQEATLIEDLDYPWFGEAQ